MGTNKQTAENPVGKKPGPGRPKGSRNKTTMYAKAMIEAAADGIGGADRMIAWIGEAPENERAFWSSIFPRLLPLQVEGPGQNGEHLVSDVTPADKLKARLDAIASRTPSGAE